ncbi:MAG TPA: BatA domain-containing protein [Pirellulaceae bacterium]|nr:BatA domain-containing protein [Pirellulaceae bacterium]
MQFVYQALTWGFLLALVPLLIHLINMMRHKRVQWAAMEFLLASYKKHKQWIWLKQLLLLLARMAAVALIVAMLAQLKTRDQWLALLGNRVTHHYVLLDDSYSMTDRALGASAFDAAQQVIRNIAGRAKSEDSPQKFTLLRFSRARGAAAGSAAEAAAQRTDFNAEPVDGAFDLTLEKKQQTFAATALSVGPLDALALVKQVLAQTRDETSVVYLLSDFRAKEWGNPSEIKTMLQEIKRHKAEIHLVSCGRSQEPNLGIVDLAPADETRAAGVPLFVNVKVRNFGKQPATKVQLKLQSTFYPPGDAKVTPAEQLKGIRDELATLVIDKIDPGETVVRRVQVYFPQYGKHVVEATLGEDPVDTDNRRLCVIDFPEGEKVLVLDGSVEQQHRYYLEVAFRPLEKSNTGIRPEGQPISFLRDATPETLKGYTAIYLLDVPTLEERAVTLLDEYVRAGGGVAIFGGPEVNVGFYNKRLYDDGKGIFPAPLAAELELPPALDSGQPDMELFRHPIFSFFLDQTNPLIRGVKIDKYLHVREGWKPAPDSGTSVLAKLRNGSPLVLEKKMGKGSVVAVLTTLAPQWNDWAKNPSIVVTVLKMQAYLATNKRLDDPRTVGTPLEVNLEAAQYRSNLVFVRPGDEPGSRVKIELQATAPESGAKTIAASLGPAAADHVGDETDRPGIYEAWPMTTKGDIDLRRWALNPDPTEGDLTTIPSQELLTRLEPVKVNFHQADQYHQEEAVASGYNLSQLVMIALVCLLIGEQFLAYSASYHPQPGAAR